MATTNDSINKTCDNFLATVKVLTPLLSTSSGKLFLDAAAGEIDVLALLTATKSANTVWMSSNQNSDTAQRWQLSAAGNLFWGDGTLPVDTQLSRLFANTLGVNNGVGGVGNLYTSSLFSGPSSYSTGTVSQTGTTVTGSGTTFTSAMIGGLLIVSGFISSIIKSVNSPTSLTVDTSTSIPGGSAFKLEYGGVQISSSGTVGAQGINLASLGNKGILFLDSNGNTKSSAALTNGQLLIGSTGADPVPNGLTAGNGITIVNSAGNITISSDDTYIGGIQQFTSSGTFTVPSNVVTVYVTGCGGGGGGAGGVSATVGSVVGGGAGGGGFTYKQAIAVTPGASIAVTIGAGGTGGVGLMDGGSGGATSFGALLTLPGGGGGLYGTGTASFPGNSWASGGGGGSLIVTGGSIAAARGEAGTNPFGLPPSYSESAYGVAGGYGVGGVSFAGGSPPNYTGQVGLPGILIIEW